MSSNDLVSKTYFRAKRILDKVAVESDINEYISYKFIRKCSSIISIMSPLFSNAGRGWQVNHRNSSLRQQETPLTREKINKGNPLKPDPLRPEILAHSTTLQEAAHSPFPP